MENRTPNLRVLFYRTESGTEPVREWLKSMQEENRKSIGEDIRAVQFKWPLGLPLIRKIEAGLWEIRSRVKDGIVRIFFTVREDRLILLHGFVKKSQATPQLELNIARERRRKHGQQA
jgi:phage-related protein